MVGDLNVPLFHHRRRVAQLHHARSSTNNLRCLRAAATAAPSRHFISTQNATTTYWLRPSAMRAAA